MTDGSSGFERDDAARHPHTFEVLESDPDDPESEYTFVPRGSDERERLTAWITVDDEGIVELSAWR